MKSYPPNKIFLNFLLLAACIVVIFLIIPGERYELSAIISGNQGVNNGRLRSRPPEFSGIMQHPADEAGNQKTQNQDILTEIPDFIHQVEIEFPDGRNSIMLPFIQSILNSEKELCRIIHIGDSQLEEDRITRFIRRRLNEDHQVLIDNLAIRGSAGLEFTKGIADSLFFGAGKELPGLLILQFGINVVPARTDDFSYYSDYLVVQLEYLGKKLPGVPILLVGVSDMGRMQDGLARPFSTVKKVSDAQRNAAFETGTAFFNLLEFMGGPGSFIKWINNDPALMRKDLTHFSFKGGEIVGEGIAEALIREIQKQIPDGQSGN